MDKPRERDRILRFKFENDLSLLSQCNFTDYKNYEIYSFQLWEKSHRYEIIHGIELSLSMIRRTKARTQRHNDAFDRCAARDNGTGGKGNGVAATDTDPRKMRLSGVIN